MKSSKENRLIIAASEYDANMYYACQFLAPDPFVFLSIRGKKYLIMNDLEVDRAKSQATVDFVISTSKLAREFHKKTKKRPSYIDILHYFMQKKKVKSFLVPANFPLKFADDFRKRKIKITVSPDPFFEERTIKTPQEVRATEIAIRHVESAVAVAIDTLKKSKVKNRKLYSGRKILTSERLRTIINLHLMERGCVGSHAIVACGKHSVDPHDEGSGPLYANQPIIMDIFPRDLKSRYHADFTRTVVKGKASEKLKKMYAAVYEGQKIGFKMIKPGVNAHTIHQAIQERFEELGFKTGLINGRMQGFFHGTGHGLGLDIHEEPHIGGAHDILKEGHVVTVEPGLYYEKIGGIRLEDVVVVTAKGCRNLTKFPKFLEL